MKFFLAIVFACFIFPGFAFALVFRQQGKPPGFPHTEEHTASYTLNDAQIQVSSGRTNDTLDSLLNRFKSLFPNARFIGGASQHQLLGCTLPDVTGGQKPNVMPFQCLWAEDQKTHRFYRHVQFSKLPNVESTTPITFAGMVFPTGKAHPHLQFSENAQGRMHWLHIHKGKGDGLRTQVETQLQARGWSPTTPEASKSAFGFSHFEKGEASLFIQDSDDALFLLHQEATP